MCREQFMEEIESMMKTLVNQYVNVPNAPARVTIGAPVVGTCPPLRFGGSRAGEGLFLCQP